MSRKRTACVGNVFRTRKQPDGSYLCSVCGKPLTGGGRRYCSDACTDIAYIATNPSWARAKVYDRDKGICAKCGVDTERLENVLRWAGSSDTDDDRHEMWRFITALKKKMGFTMLHMWEMDHILPVSEGGGLCGLENLQTLCIPCHRAETKELVRRRAAAKRGTPLFYGELK